MGYKKTTGKKSSLGYPATGVGSAYNKMTAGSLSEPNGTVAGAAVPVRRTKK